MGSIQRGTSWKTKEEKKPYEGCSTSRRSRNREQSGYFYLEPNPRRGAAIPTMTQRCVWIRSNDALLWKRIRWPLGIVTKINFQKHFTEDWKGSRRVILHLLHINQTNNILKYRYNNGYRRHEICFRYLNCEKLVYTIILQLFFLISDGTFLPTEKSHLKAMQRQLYAVKMSLNIHFFLAVGHSRWLPNCLQILTTSLLVFNTHIKKKTGRNTFSGATQLIYKHFPRR